MVAETSDFNCRRVEGRGFSPAAEFRRHLGALAPEATWLQGLKAHSTLRPEAAGLNRLRKNSFGVSFRGAAGDEESRIGLKTLRARFLAEFTLSGQSEILRCAQGDSEGLGMTAWKGLSAACKAPPFRGHK